MFKIKKIKIHLVTENGDYSYSCSFVDGLNIIRGDNSSGKSTLLSCMYYACGMEELLGSKSADSLQYAVRDYVELDSKKVRILSSQVMLEVENKQNNIVTFKRYIRSKEKSEKLIEIIEGPYLTEPAAYEVSSKFIHDSGAAVSDEYGFHRYLETYMGYELPMVPSTSGGLVKLYIQTIFAALFVEQKRGWTDYVAGIPYFKIKNVFFKVVEYVLNLDVFENDRTRSELIERESEIQKKWSEIYYQIKFITDKVGLVVKGVPLKSVSDFDGKLVSILKLDDDNEVSVYDYISLLNERFQEHKAKLDSNGIEGSERDNELVEINEKISTITLLMDELSREISINMASIKKYENDLLSIEEDIKKNKLAKKVKKMGGALELKMASDLCPLCQQTVDDTLLLTDTMVQPMTIDENIVYLESQKKMLERYVAGTKELLSRQKQQYSNLASSFTELKKTLVAHKRDLGRVNQVVKEADLRKLIQLEDMVSDLTSTVDELMVLFGSLESVSLEKKNNSLNIAGLPKEYLSHEDLKKIKVLEREFKSMAKEFGYRSADIDDIEINEDTYTPFLSGRELREINVKIESASSASDFVRLIWAYLISLYRTSYLTFSNHPGILVFDEPGQHSMSTSSMNELFKNLERQDGLQSIVAASFDESDETYDACTLGVDPNLIRLERKLFS